MIHCLQVMWWELKWRRLKVKRARLHAMMPVVWASDTAEYARLVRSAVRMRREMDEIESRIAGRTP